VNFLGQPPSEQWAALKYRGEKLAEVWFKPEGEPFGLTFRIPNESFQVPGLAPLLTIENLLKALTIVPEEVESWGQGDGSHSARSESDPDLKSLLDPPPPHADHLEIHVRLKPPEAGAPLLSPSPVGEEAAGEREDNAAETSPLNWQDLEARWKAILGLEAAVDALRSSMESLLTELENSLQKTLSIEEKSYAPRSDISQWERAKSRVHFAVPKMREFIHRATWALGSPERKRLEHLYKEHIQPQIPLPQINEALNWLEDLQKDRQVLAALGKMVYQECRGVSAGIQGALRTLHEHAADARRKNAAAAKGRFFK
jgi:hypothetical protein